MKIIITICIVCVSFATLLAQTVRITELPLNRVSNINADNWYLVDEEVIPQGFRERRSENIFRSHVLASWLSRREASQDWVDYINRQRERANAWNDYTPIPRVVVFKNNNKVITKKYPTHIEYFYDEGCGFRKAAVVGNLELNNRSDLIGVFSTNIVNAECSSTYVKIRSPYDRDFDEDFSFSKRFLFPSRRYEIGNYIIEHTASFSEGGFSFGGVGTITPTFFNIEISITDTKRNKSQTLLKIPHGSFHFQLASILIADINCDSIPDIILTVEDEMCELTLFYLSTPDGDSLFKFVGFSENCECP